MFLCRTYQAEAVDDLVRDEISIVTADLAMMKVIVLSFVLHIRRERGWKVFVLGVRNHVHYVVRYERREPAHSLAAEFQVVGDPPRRGRHDFDAVEIPVRL